MNGLGQVHHLVTTNNTEAQKWFDQGLALVYGFNHDEARHSFERAAALDPDLAMAWWGAALALGPNINVPIDAQRESAAYEAIQRAIALQAKASEPERAYIQALACRYTNDSRADYARSTRPTAMPWPSSLVIIQTTSMQRRFMPRAQWTCIPGAWWSHDGRPVEGTEEIVSVLESALQRDPNHLGANHYYIHAVEASPHPERGLACAMRLEKLAPAAGHLLHMPSHIYARVGDYEGAVRSNESALAADDKYLRAHQHDFGALMYHAHNVHFLAYAACMNGDFPGARKAAVEVAALVTPRVKEMPATQACLCNFAATPAMASKPQRAG